MKITTKKLTTCAILAAMFFALAYLSFGTNDFKISLESLAVIIGGLTLGPIGGALVGFVGEFLYQVSYYGMDPTTFLWLLPYMADGIICGLFVLNKKEVSNKRIILAIITGEVSLTALVTCVNAIAATIQGWGTWFTILAGVPLRLLIMLARIVILCVIVPILYKSLKKVIK